MWKYSSFSIFRRGEISDNIYNFINGEFVPPDSGEFGDTHNPSTGEALCKYPLSNVFDLQKAIEAASSAYHIWKRQSTVSTEIPLEKLTYFYEVNSICAFLRLTTAFLFFSSWKPGRKSRSVEPNGQSFREEVRAFSSSWNLGSRTSDSGRVQRRQWCGERSPCDQTFSCTGNGKDGIFDEDER